MKRLLPFLIALISISSYAQQNSGERHNRIKTLKIAFITEKLSLTEVEAQKFWPIYNAFDHKTTKIKFQDIRKIRQELRQGIETMSDEKANDLLNRFMDAENRLHIERTELVKKLRSVISAKKIILLKTAEDDFNRKMLDRFKNQRQRMNKNKP